MSTETVPPPQGFESPQDDWEKFASEHLAGEAPPPEGEPPAPEEPSGEEPGARRSQPRDELGRYRSGEEEPEGNEEPQGDLEGDVDPGEEPEPFHVPLKVAGEEVQHQMSRAAWDALSEQERSDLVARLQKSYDYDRPGGALDRASEKRARDMLVEAGVLERDPLTGLYQHTNNYKQWLARGEAPQTSAPEPQPTTTPPDPNAELEALWAKVQEENTQDAYRQFAIRSAQIEAERVAQRLQDEQRQRAMETERQQKLRQIQDHIAGRVNAELAAAQEQLADPQTGKVDPKLEELVRRTALATITTQRDLDAGLQVIRDMAAREAQRNSAVRDFLAKANRPAPTKRTAEAPPAVRGGHAPSPTQEEEFDPDDPFGRKSGKGGSSYGRIMQKYGVQFGR